MPKLHLGWLFLLVFVSYDFTTSSNMQCCETNMQELTAVLYGSNLWYLLKIYMYVLPKAVSNLCAAEKANMAWFSKLGAIYQRFNQGITATGLAAVLFGCFYPQTLGLKRYQNLVAFYKDGIAVPVDSETQQLVEKVCLCFNVNYAPLKNNVILRCLLYCKTSR